MLEHFPRCNFGNIEPVANGPTDNRPMDIILHIAAIRAKKTRTLGYTII